MSKLNLKALVALSFILLFLSLEAKAQVRLFVVHAENTVAPMLLAAKPTETPEAAWNRYVKELNKHPDLVELFAGRNPQLEITQVSELSTQNLTNKVLLLANLPKDYTLDTLRVEKFVQAFSKSSQESLLLPIAAGLGLTRAEHQEFLNLISEKFPLLVAMGGDDVDPSKYGRDNMHSRNVVPTRDHHELQVIKSFTQKAKGFLLGVCRGSQISAVALGYKLHQHVPLHVGTEVAHGNDWHDIKVLKTEHRILSELAGGAGKLHVNSLHHQAVRYHENGPLQIAARTEDGVTEALEFKNGKGLLLQFHPELMNNELGQDILNQVVKTKSRVQYGSCGKVF